MVEIKMRKGKLGELKTKADVEIVDCTKFELITCMVELEKLIAEIIKGLENETDLNLHEAFIENMVEYFNE